MELADEASVERCVQRLNGKLVPGSNPVSSYDLTSAPSSKIVLTCFHFNVDLLLLVSQSWFKCLAIGEWF